MATPINAHQVVTRIRRFFFIALIRDAAGEGDVMAGLGKGNNACSVLNSYHQGCKYELLEECGPPHMKEFTFAVDVLGRQYVGKGRSKKLASRRPLRRH